MKLNKNFELLSPPNTDICIIFMCQLTVGSTIHVRLLIVTSINHMHFKDSIIIIVDLIKRI